jgi:hypothetical protein
LFSRDADRALLLLDTYESSKRERSDAGRARVQLAILKLSDGRINKLEDAVVLANRDFRDVLAYAEYPTEMGYDWNTLKSMPAEAVQRIRDADRRQYEEWLARE